MLNTVNSFALNETLRITLNGTELEFRSSAVTDAEPAEQTLPLDNADVVVPALASEFDKEMTVRRDVLVNAMNKILFSIGFEKFRPEFLYWIMRVKNGNLRAVCGDGARFAVYEIDGDSVVKTKKPFDLCVHKDQTPVVQKIFSLFPDDEVTIQSYARGDNDSLMDQIVMKVGSATMILVGHDPGVKWPNESKFLERENSFKYVTAASDWELIMKGVMATYNESMKKTNQIHPVQTIFNGEEKIVNVITNAQMKANRKIKLRDAKFDGESKIDFTCVSSYVADMLKHAGPDDAIQIEFTNDKAPAVFRLFASDTVTDGPIQKVNAATDTKEQYTLFFAAYNRK